MKRGISACLAGAIWLSGCVAPGAASLDRAAEPLAVADARCSDGSVAIDTAFDAGALASCTVGDDGRISITLSPEDAPPINCSAWYAFRLHSNAPRVVGIDLNYTACGHRYEPKVSYDGVEWTYLDPAKVEVMEVEGTRMARLSIRTDGRPIFVSAQEIIVPATYDAWLDGLEETGMVERETLGHSAEGRAIEIMYLGNPAAREQVVLVGRQHPPEVTGALAMFPFVETLLEHTELARRFRERFRVSAVPLLNPDGVVKGHWRHNTGGVDLNRDWGPFTQPETQLMRDVLVAIDNDPDRRLRLLLDFHSTGRDIFYTIPDELPTDPPLFTRDWLARYQDRMSGYEVTRDARHEVGRPISKAHAFDTYGVPAVTFELGDETDRTLIRRIGREAAIAMMEELLATERP
ncbi:peptidase M14 [Erythrobacter aquimaris]|uniref:Peptidase M14 n=1 Tax=Qipengyuania aquimaris TaxID=255984 RepID=A0A6I4TKN3_9SPHN|nr:M14-type cytosolic carboxypeptidase [Qipengyuania aquimaris]MXO96572.1 peptidase M14 [Qipengyuania aquimaris]